jgi:hypothetical protein
MKHRRSKLVVMQAPHGHIGSPQTHYKVVRLTNRTDPEIGEYLTQTDIDHLLENEPDCDVDIVPYRPK